MRPVEPRQPKVFISFAGDDRPVAELVGQGLRRRGVEPFIDVAIGPAVNIVLAINEALTRSDYFILLWSQHCVDRGWVDAEWSAALARELDQQRSFLFIMRLDTSNLPLLLAPRKYLDAFGNWERALDCLVEAWRRDLDMDLPVLPAPGPALKDHPEDRDSAIIVYIRNRDLRVAHTVAVSPGLTGSEFERLIREKLALPEEQTGFGGLVGLRFHYRFKYNTRPLPDGVPEPLNIADGSMIDLEVRMEPFGPNGTMDFRNGKEPRPEPDGSPTISPALVDALKERAFRHLRP